MLEGGRETGTDGRTAGLLATDGLKGSACGDLLRWMLMAAMMTTKTAEDINRLFLFNDVSHELLFYPSTDQQRIESQPRKLLQTFSLPVLLHSFFNRGMGQSPIGNYALNKAINSEPRTTDLRDDAPECHY